MKIFSYISLAIALFFFFVNFCGWSCYAHLNIADNDLIAGSSAGGVHVALGKHYEFTSSADFPVESGDFQFYDLLIAGPVYIHAESGFGMTPLTFNYNNSNDYKSVDFPLLLIMVFIAALLYRLHKINKEGLTNE